MGDVVVEFYKESGVTAVDLEYIWDLRCGILSFLVQGVECNRDKEFFCGKGMAGFIF